MKKRAVTSERARLCEETLSAVRLVKDAPGGNATSIATTDKLLHSAKSAFIKYEQLLEEENKLKSEESEKTKVS